MTAIPQCSGVEIEMGLLVFSGKAKDGVFMSDHIVAEPVYDRHEL